MNHSEAMAASRARDGSRSVCDFCFLPLADQVDCDLFDGSDEGTLGGERTDLCWRNVGGDDECAMIEELHEAIGVLRANNFSHGNILAIVKRALLLKPEQED